MAQHGDYPSNSDDPAKPLDDMYALCIEDYEFDLIYGPCVVCHGYSTRLTNIGAMCKTHAREHGEIDPVPEPRVQDGKARGVTADGRSGGKYHRFVKKQKNRLERRRAKRNPECIPGYNKHNGWES